MEKLDIVATRSDVERTDQMTTKESLETHNDEFSTHKPLRPEGSHEKPALSPTAMMNKLGAVSRTNDTNSDKNTSQEANLTEPIRHNTSEHFHGSKLGDHVLPSTTDDLERTTTIKLPGDTNTDEVLLQVGTKDDYFQRTTTIKLSGDTNSDKALLQLGTKDNLERTTTIELPGDTHTNEVVLQVGAKDDLERTTTIELPGDTNTNNGLLQVGTKDDLERTTTTELPGDTHTDEALLQLGTKDDLERTTTVELPGDTYTDEALLQLRTNDDLERTTTIEISGDTNTNEAILQKRKFEETVLRSTSMNPDATHNRRIQESKMRGVRAGIPLLQNRASVTLKQSIASSATNAKWKPKPKPSGTSKNKQMLTGPASRKKEKSTTGWIFDTLRHFPKNDRPRKARGARAKGKISSAKRGQRRSQNHRLAAEKDESEEMNRFARCAPERRPGVIPRKRRARKCVLVNKPNESNDSRVHITKKSTAFHLMRMATGRKARPWQGIYFYPERILVVLPHLPYVNIKHVHVQFSYGFPGTISWLAVVRKTETLYRRPFHMQMKEKNDSYAMLLVYEETRELMSYPKGTHSGFVVDPHTGNYVLSGSTGFRVLSGGRCIFEEACFGEVVGLAFATKSREMVFARLFQGNVEFNKFRISDRKRVSRKTRLQALKSMAVSPNGKIIYMCTQGLHSQMWGRPIKQISDGPCKSVTSRPRFLAVITGNWLLVLSTKNKILSRSKLPPFDNGGKWTVE